MPTTVSEQLMREKMEELNSLACKHSEKLREFYDLCEKYYGEENYNEHGIDDIIDTLEYGKWTISFKDFDAAMKEINPTVEENKIEFVNKNDVDREVVESIKRLELCRGCDDLCKKMQIRRFKADGRTEYNPRKEVMHWFCREYGLHLEYMDRIIGRGHAEDGEGKECDKYRN